MTWKGSFRREDKHCFSLNFFKIMTSVPCTYQFQEHTLAGMKNNASNGCVTAKGLRENKCALS